jgi:pyruvate dehydrogenase E2 component (dihydrolipoamide acetyltransferase)
MVDYRLPDLGEGMTEAELVRWLVKPGDAVRLDQPLAELQTDKVLAELPAPAAGVIRALHVAEGQVVPVGTNLLTIDTDAAQAAPMAGPMPATGAHAAPRQQEQAAAADQTRSAVAAAFAVGAANAANTGGAANAGSAATNGWSPVSTVPERRALATPAVRRLARERGVDIHTVRGSGTAGRVLAQDVLELVAVPAAPQQTLEPSLAPETAALTAPAEATPAPATATITFPGEAEVADERIPLRGLRRRIAENMVRSASTIPQVTSFVEVDGSALVALRLEVQPAAEAQGLKLSYLPFIVKALVQALRAYPYLNAAIDDEAKQIVLRRQYHIGIATATPDGLLVPVLRHADRLSLTEIARELSRLAEGGRARTLGMQDLRGSTFTISNFGSVGGFFATPIINPGEAGILGLGRIADRPWVAEGRVEARPVLPLSLTVDHRLIDGDMASGFLNVLIALLEHPGRIMLEMR